jgi:hypothetical protein
MTRETTYIDLNSGSDLPRLIREAARGSRRVVLRDDDADVAVLAPAKRRRRLPGKRPTQADIDAALATFGSWKGHIDAERFKRDIKAARSDHRPSVKR